MRSRFPWAAAAALALPWAVGAVETVTFESGGPGVPPAALLELFSSEGCSSCPPADRWMSELKDARGLWTEFVPVAFHVDYWDSLGWKDPWARSEYTERQRAYARAWGSRGVYTPGFVYDGREWREWFSNPRLPPRPRESRGRLKVTVRDGSSIRVEYAPSGPAKAGTAAAALLGFGLASSVRSGENRNRRLEHDFLVLDWKRAALAPSGEIQAAELAVKDPGGTGRRGLAVWIEREGRPVAAAGGYLPVSEARPAGH